MTRVSNSNRSAAVPRLLVGASVCTIMHWRWTTALYRSCRFFKNGSSQKSVMKNRHFSDSRQRASDDLQAQILLITQSIRASLDDSNLIVEALNEAKRHLVFWRAIGSNSIPMTLDHLGKL